MIATMTIPPLDTFENLIHKQASYCWKRLPNPKPLEYDDLVGEGRYCYLIGVQKFDPARKTKFITLFHLMLRHHFSGILHTAYKSRRVDPAAGFCDFLRGRRAAGREDIEDRGEPQDRINEKFLQGLSRNAFIFVRELIDPSDGFMRWEEENYRNVTQNSKIARGRIFRYLGWDRKRKLAVMTELKRKFDGL